MRRNRVYWRAGFSLILSVIVLVGLWPAAVRADGGERLVLAFYYNWFDENTWTPSKVPDFPAQTYVSRDRAAMARHIDQAKSAGIDALVVNWWGPQDNNQTDTNLRVMLDEAAARGFRIAVDVDLNSPYLRSAGAIQAAMSTLLSSHANHSAYLKVDGKPVVFFYHQNHRLSTNGWAAVRNAVDPGRNSLWIEEGTDVSPLTVFDGHHLYSVSWANRTDMGYTANKFARLVRAKAAALGAPKIYVSTVMPGYDDRKAGRGSAAFALGREDGAYYVRSWQAAIGSAPDWIVINSFNEWREGTYIEPSQTYGNLFLDLTAQWSAAFRGSAPPPPAPTPKPKPKVAAPAKPKPTLVKPTPTPQPTPTPTRTPKPGFVRPSGPSGE